MQKDWGGGSAQVPAAEHATCQRTCRRAITSSGSAWQKDSCGGMQARTRAVAASTSGGDAQEVSEEGHPIARADSTRGLGSSSSDQSAERRCLDVRWGERLILELPPDADKEEVREQATRSSHTQRVLGRGPEYTLQVISPHTLAMAVEAACHQPSEASQQGSCLPACRLHAF